MYSNLPSQFDEIYNQRTNNLGVALFSLGTVSNSTYMPENMLRTFYDAFFRLPEITFIWKTEEPEEIVKLMGNVTNIHLIKWFPQKLLLSKSSNSFETIYLKALNQFQVCP